MKTMQTTTTTKKRTGPLLASGQWLSLLIGNEMLVERAKKKKKF
jgi:hypothetical protein